jgi:hypothetical protein
VYWTCAVVFVTSAILLACWVRSNLATASGSGPPFTISAETTRIVAPLRADGYVDYCAALNATCTKGVTPENNAVVAIWQVLGPKSIDVEDRGRYFKLLGVPSPPAKGDYLVPPFGKEHTAAAAEWDDDSIIERPWAKEKSPNVAAWLSANEKRLDRLAEATHRERFYSPLLGAGEGPQVMGSLLFLASEGRTLGRYLAARAMLRIGSGQLREAKQDALALHRLGRLIGQGPTLVEALVAIGIDHYGIQADIAIAGSGKVSVDACHQFAKDLDHLPPLPIPSEKIDLGERYSLLDAISSLARDAKLRLQDAGPLAKIYAGITGENNLDWDVALRLTNEWMDRVTAAEALPTFRERRQAEARWSASIRQMAAEAKGTSFSRSARSERNAKTMVSLMLPAVGKACIAFDKSAEWMNLVQLSLTLAAFHADKGKYPAKLSELAPVYAPNIPDDMFSGAPLHYEVQGSGYVLYSVGPNPADQKERLDASWPPRKEPESQIILLPPK